MKRRKFLGIFSAALLVCIAAATVKVAATPETEDSKRQTDTETVSLTKEQEKSLSEIKAVYNVEKQEKIAEKLEEKKASQDYTVNNMLIEQNPFGTNTQSLYIYFRTEKPTAISYTIHVDDDSIGDFSRTVYQDSQYQKEHEYQVIGLIPDMSNKITFLFTRQDGSADKKEIIVDMGSLMGTEELKLDTDMEGNAAELKDGLYTVLGNDSTALDFMYYYDNEGVLRGEVPLLGYRSHRVIFDDDSMYYSISEKKIAQVNRLGQVTNIYDLGSYSLHHDYIFDDNGNMLVLASDDSQDSVEDIILKLDVVTGKVTEVLDLGDLFSDYKAQCQTDSEGELDWMHINTIQWIEGGAVLLSSRETSSIIKIDSIYASPSVAYIIGEPSLWEGTEYGNLVFKKDGDFIIHGGQHSVTYVKDMNLKDGQYYLYMYNNNIGISDSNPDFDWTLAGLSENTAKDGKTSYYYKYLVDENAGTYKLADSFEVPYSGYVSSAQDIGKNTVVDSGFKGMFAEYDESHNLIASYKMEMEKFIYRVYKYDFAGFYFK